jgi:glycosyltransferase involved in cell wall biosynthesis
MSTKPRIVFLSNALDISGGEMILIRLLENNPEIDATLVSPNPELIERLRPCLSDAVLLPCFQPLRRRNPLLAIKRLLVNYPLAIASIARIAARQDRQIIMAGAFSSAGIAWIAAALAGIKAGWMHQHPVLREGSSDARTAAFLVTRGLHAITCSKAMALPILEKKDQASKVAVIPNSVDTAAFDPATVSRDQAEKLLHAVPATARRVALGAMITEWKGHHLLVEAVALLKERGLDASKLAVLLIGGVYENRAEDEAYRQRVKAQAERLGVTDQLFWLGKQNAMASLFAASDVLLNCSIEPEPFGITIIEAMAMKRIVLVPDIGGPAEIVTDGIDGFQFRSNDAHSLADRLGWILAHLPELDGVREAARQVTLTKYQNYQVQEKYLEVFREMTEAVPT